MPNRPTDDQEETKIDPFANIAETPLENKISATTRKLITQADVNRKNRGKFGGITLGSDRFNKLNSNWGGIDIGTHIIGGDTNLGKSSFLRMMAWDIVNNNPNVHLRFYTLDDAENYFFDCMVAQAIGVPINAIHKPEAFLEKPHKYYNQRELEAMVTRGNKQYEKMVDPKILERFSFVGTDTLEDASWSRIRDDIRDTKKHIGNKQLVVCIDNLHDIEVTGFTDTNEKTEAVAKEVDKLAKEEQVVLIGTVELKKNQQRRPIIDDIYGSRKWKYKARTIILVYSEVGAGKTNPRLYFERLEFPGEQCSVFECHFAKSKVSEFKGRLFFEQFTEQGTMREVYGDAEKHYVSQIS